MAKRVFREITLQLTVTVPAATAERDVEAAIDAALDEPPCDWGVWKVGGVEITAVRKFKAEDELDIFEGAEDDEA